MAGGVCGNGDMGGRGNPAAHQIGVRNACAPEGRPERRRADERASAGAMTVMPVELNGTSGGVTQANIYSGTAPDSQMLLVQLITGKTGKTG